MHGSTNIKVTEHNVCVGGFLYKICLQYFSSLEDLTDTVTQMHIKQELSLSDFNGT